MPISVNPIEVRVLNSGDTTLAFTSLLYTTIEHLNAYIMLLIKARTPERGFERIRACVELYAALSASEAIMRHTPDFEATSPEYVWVAQGDEEYYRVIMTKDEGGTECSLLT